MLLFLRPHVVESEAQFLYPATTEQAGSWTPVNAATLHAALAEKLDTSYIQLLQSNMPSTARVKLDAGQAPQAGDRTWRCRISRDGVGDVDFTVTLREGGGSTLGGGTLKGTITQTVSSASFATFEVLITDSISNYGDLYAEVTADLA